MNSEHLFCDYCGRANKIGARYCRVCGQPLSKDTPVSPSSAHPKTLAVRTPTGHLRFYQLLKQRYRILQLLGQGGMGHVYKAEDLQLGDRPVAIKEMSQQGLTTQEIVEAAAAFKREAIMLANLKHSNLPWVYDHFDEMGHWYLVMEFIDGETLTQYLDKADGGCLSIQETLHIGFVLCDVLDYLHRHSPPIIFRDLKPDNIMLTPDKHLYLIDFGIARHFKTGKSKDTGSFFTFGYAAPEQYGQRQTTPRSDIYSLGATLYHLLSGQHPASTLFRFVPLQLQGHPNAAQLEALIMQMVDSDEKKRPASAVAVKEELKRIRDQRIREQKVSFQPISYQTEPEPSASSQTASKSPTPSPSASQQSVSPSPTPSPSAPKQSVAQMSTPSQATPHPAVSSLPASSHAVSGSSIPIQPTVNQPTSPLPPSINEILVSHAGSVRTMVWSPDGTHLACGSEETVYVWDTSTGEKLLTYQGHANVVSEVVWSPDGKRIASGGWDKVVQVWDATTGKRVFPYTGHTDPIRAVAWSPDGTKLASAGRDKMVRVWNATMSSDIYTYKEHTARVNRLAWSPDSKQLASVSQDKTVRVWEATTGQPLLSDHHEGVVYGVAWSPNGKYLASCSEDRTVQIWDLTTKMRGVTYTLHKNWVYAVAWSADSKYIASASRDKQVHIWEASILNGPKVYSCNTDQVLAVAWSPGGTHIAYSDGNVVLVKKVE